MDKPLPSPEAPSAANLSLTPAHYQATGPEIAGLKQPSQASAKQILPNLSIDDSSKSSSKPQGQSAGVLGVIEDLGIGAYKEVTQHTGRVIENAAIGLGVGVAASFLAPEVALVAGGAAALYGGYELATHVGSWVHDAKVVADPGSYKQSEVARAHVGLQGLGAGGVDMAAGAVGGIYGARIASVAKVAIAGLDAPEATVASAKAPIDQEAPPAVQSSVKPEATAQPEAVESPPESVKVETDANRQVRQFKIVKGDYGRVVDQLGAGGSGGKLIVREIQADGQLGDELKVWLQHHGPVEGGNGAFTPLSPMAEKADLIISCFPDLIEDSALLAKHVFPNGEGVIATGLDPADPSIMVVQPDFGWKFAKVFTDSIAEALAEARAADGELP